MASYDDSLMPPRPRRGGGMERGWSDGTAAAPPGAPGKQTLTQAIRAADPRTVLLAKLRTVRGQLTGVRERHLPGMRAAIDGRDMRAAATAGVELGGALATIDRELAEARALAAEQADGALAQVEQLAIEHAAVRAEATPVLALAPPSARKLPALAGFAAHLFLDDAASDPADDAEAHRRWIARLDGGAPDVQEAAARGAATPAQPVPHLARLQAAFGAQHDLSTIQAHVGGAAAGTAAEMGAAAYATGDDVVLPDSPGLGLVAHEVAHVVQQRAGVQVAGGVGSAGDRYEQQADAVAGAVTRGEPVGHHVAAATGAAGAAVQRKEAAPTEAGDRPVNKPSAPELPDGVAYQHVPGTFTIWVRRSWLTDDPTATAVSDPDKNAELLWHLRDRGVLDWATPEDLAEAAAHVAITLRSAAPAEVVAVHLDAAVFHHLGLPPSALAMVNARGDGLDVVVRVDAVSVERGGSFEMSSALKGRILTAITAHTGLASDPAWTQQFLASPLTAELGASTVYVTLDGGLCRTIFGAEAYDAWLARPRDDSAASGGAGEVGVVSELAPDELAEIQAWLARYATAAAPAGTTILDRGLLALIRRIEHSRHRDAILEALRDAGARGDGAPLDAGALEDLVDSVEFHAARAAAKFSPEERAEGPAPIHPFPIPARIDQQSGLVIAGELVPFLIEIDWPVVLLEGDTFHHYQFRSWVTHIDWLFERLDGKGTPETDEGSLMTEAMATGARASISYQGKESSIYHRFLLEDGEDEATWQVRAFVQNSHFLPREIVTPVRVATETKRMSELRDAEFAGMGEREAAGHNFDLSLFGEVGSEVTGDGQYDEGLKIEGSLPNGFVQPTPEQRLGRFDRDLENARALLGYLQSHDPGAHEDAIESARAFIKKLEAARAAVDADLDAGWQPFELRGTFLSRQSRLIDGPLDLHGSVQVVPGGLVVVKIRDLSRRFESDNYQLTGVGMSFESALERVYLDLCKAYPPGRLAVLAEVIDPGTGESTGKTLGFELDTGTSWEDARAAVFDPLVQTTINLAGIALMIFVPASAPLVLPTLAALNAVQTIDDLADQATKGTLTRSDVGISAASIALDLLPMIGRVKPLASSRAALFWLEGVDVVGQVILMTAQARDGIHDLREGEIAQMAQVYARLVELEQSTHASDPRLVEQRRQVEEGSQRIREAAYRVIGQLIADQALFTVASHVFHGLNRSHLGQQQYALASQGGFRDGKPGEPLRYDRDTGQIAGDQALMTDALWAELSAQQRDHLASLASRLDAGLELADGTTQVVFGDQLSARWDGDQLVLTYKPGVDPEHAHWIWHQQAAMTLPASRPEGSAADGGAGQVVGSGSGDPPRRHAEDQHPNGDADPARHDEDGPYVDPRESPGQPRRRLERRELDPVRRLGLHPSWKSASAALKRQTSVAIGRTLKTAEHGHSIIERLARGDASALSDLGLDDVPADLDPMGREWALVEARDGFVIYASRYGEVELPSAVRVLSHSHPGPVPSAELGSKKPTKDVLMPEGQAAQTYEAILADADNARDSGITPSAEDIHAITDGGPHVIYTRYVHSGDRLVANPVDGDAAPRVALHLSGARVVRWQRRQKQYWYEVNVEVKDSLGALLWQGQMYVNWSAPSRNGTIKYERPPEFDGPAPAGWEDM